MGRTARRDSSLCRVVWGRRRLPSRRPVSRHRASACPGATAWLNDASASSSQDPFPDPELGGSSRDQVPILLHVCITINGVARDPREPCSGKKQFSEQNCFKRRTTHWITESIRSRYIRTNRPTFYIRLLNTCKGIRYGISNKK